MTDTWVEQAVAWLDARWASWPAHIRDQTDARLRDALPAWGVPDTVEALSVLAAAPVMYGCWARLHPAVQGVAMAAAARARTKEQQ